jgi:hypothetical protein
VGLGAVTTIWLAWVIFGWVGAREQFSGRLLPPEAMTDEYLWATPQFGVSAIKRPGAKPPAQDS